MLFVDFWAGTGNFHRKPLFGGCQLARLPLAALPQIVYRYHAPVHLRGLYLPLHLHTEVHPTSIHPTTFGVANAMAH
jgi:hypothetical protein